MAIDIESDRSPAVRALARRLGTTGSRIALREKRRGRWRAISWDELASLVDDESTAPTRPLTARAIARVLAGQTIDASRLAAAEARVRVHGLGPADEALVIAPTTWARHEADLLAEWLVAGFTLALPETVDSVGVDIREVRPSYVFAPARTFEAIYAETEARLPAPGTRRRRWIDRALASRNALANLLIRAPLRRAIGWSRVRIALTLEGTLDGAAARFFTTLGVPATIPAATVTFHAPRLEGA